MYSYLDSGPFGQQQVRTISTDTRGTPKGVSGVASRASELQKAVSELEQLAYQVKNALGLSGPETANTPEPHSLAETLAHLCTRITGASCDLNEVLTHLNS